MSVPAETPHRKAEHPVRKYFTFDPTTKESRCVLPGCKRPKLPDDHAGNMEKHIKRRHKDKYDELKLDLKKYRLGKVKKREKGRVKSTSLKVAMTARQLQLCCVRLVAVHGRPFSLMNDAAFQDIVRPMLDAMPARERITINDESIRNMVKEEAARVRDFIKSEIKGKLISLKVDSTSKNYNSYFGVNIQFSHGGKVQLRTLTVKHLLISQTAENLKNEIIEILREFGVNVSQLVSFTCDNGSNMLRAADLLKDAQDEEQKLCDEDLEEMELYVEEEGFRLTSVKCSAHTLQLAITDDTLKKSERHLALLKKIREVIKTLRSEGNRKKIKKAGLPLPFLDNSTRWNTSFNMLKSIQKLRALLQDEDEEDWLLSATEWDEIDEMVKSLEPAMIATKSLQAEQLSLGDMYGVWLECKMRLIKIGTPLSKAIAENMTKRERRQVYARSHVNAGNEKVPALFEYPGFEATILLDPRYFMILEPEEVISAKTYIRKLYSRLESLTQPQSTTGNQDTVEEPEDIADDSEDEVASMLRQKDQERRRGASVTRVDILAQVESFFSTTSLLKNRKTPILEWWEGKKMVWPELYVIAKILHSIPATQVSVERLFSALRFIMHYLRTGLDPEMIDDLILIYSNSSLMKEDILDKIEKTYFNNSSSDDNDDDEDDIGEVSGGPSSRSTPSSRSASTQDLLSTSPNTSSIFDDLMDG